MVTERAGERGIEPLAAGEAEREAGGVRVERKREAAEEGVERRSRRGRVVSDCGWARGCEEEGRDWRFLGSREVMAEAAGGRGWTGWRFWSCCVRWASSGGCMGWLRWVF
jgi:hypothetical protein